MGTMITKRYIKVKNKIRDHKARLPQQVEQILKGGG
jgi:hypothetical protein